MTNLFALESAPRTADYMRNAYTGPGEAIEVTREYTLVANEVVSRFWRRVLEILEGGEDLLEVEE